MKRSIVFAIVSIFGLMLWGCSSQSQDPVSSTGSPEITGLQALHKTIGSTPVVNVAVTGLTATISWNTVAADTYHVVMTFNGNPYLNTKVTALQLVVPNLLFGNYSVTVAPIYINYPEGTASDPFLFTVTLPSPTDVRAVVSGSTATVSWDTVATANAYHVVITQNGNPYLDVIQNASPLLVPNLVAGSYSVTVAAVVNSAGTGTASAPVVFTISSIVAPTVTVHASPIPRCIRNGEWVTVTFSGVVTNSAGGASYSLNDEYNQLHYTGTVAAGAYSVKLNLKDRRLGFDRDGRQYTFTITATNSAGTATASVVVTVPRDNDYRGFDDDDNNCWGWFH
jgi:flagellar basal-body rod modification protein FlgD